MIKAATVLLLALTVPSLVLADEPLNPPRQAPVLTEAAPGMADGAEFGACQARYKPRCACIARVWDWLTYQPLMQPNKCCKWSAMPCCAPRNYTYFPCSNSCGSAVASYSAGSCSCQH